MKSLLSIIICTFLIISCGENKDYKEQSASKLENNSEYLAIGQKISEESFIALRSELMKAMAAKEIPGAIEFCNLAAYPITDSLSKVFDSKIKRTSLKFRNPNNAPTESEKRVLEYYEKLRLNGIQPNDSIIRISDDQLWYVKPIYIQGICQNCHGSVGSTLTAQNYEVIKKLYPDDKAIEYQSGDLRGMWSIILNIKK